MSEIVSRARIAGAFPKSVCTSVNEVLCHGIPDSRALRNGDIINIDVTVFLEVPHSPALLHGHSVLSCWGPGRAGHCLLGTAPASRHCKCLRPVYQCLPALQGYHGDTSAMFMVGEVSPEARRISDVTRQCMDAGIAQCRPGAPVRNIGKVRAQLGALHRPHEPSGAAPPQYRQF